MAIIYPGGRGRWYAYPGDEDYDDDFEDSMYCGAPMNFGGPRGRGDWFPGYGMYPQRYRPFTDFYHMGGHHSFYQSWPLGKEEKKDDDEDKKKKDWHHHPGSSGKKAFFLVRPKGGNWKGYCDHMPAKKNGIKASPPFWYLFT